jgi:exoribonuclease II
MNVFYEEEGGFKVGAVLADNTTSLQVEAPHGKRSKIKAANVLLRFAEPALGEFLTRAQSAADAIDIDFLWQCCGAAEFDYLTLAREYFGHEPSAVESAGTLMRLHGAPMYFYKKGRGRYKAAPEESLKAALASVERKKLQAALKQQYMEQLAAAQLPEAYLPVLKALLYKPDTTSIEWKALEDASAAQRLTPTRLLERCGALPSTHDYHLGRFLFENFPRGAEHADYPAPDAVSDLLLADVQAYSIDDAATTEIDDAFSLSSLPNGNTRIGIHIAVPVLGITPESAFEDVAHERLSTVYFPGGKITMLPDAAIDRYTLAEQREQPALSLYAEITPDYQVIATETRVERVRIAANLRHEALEPVFNTVALERGDIAHAQGAELMQLWRFASHIGHVRRGGVPEQEQRAEYAFQVENDRVSISRRVRGSAIDRLVSELMIFVNSTWGRALADNQYAAIYRVQSTGKVRMSTVPAAHEGLGLDYYIWASSPLRRYIDLVNQRQLVALARGETPPYGAGDEKLLSVMRDFEMAYDAYAEFQRMMERYWSLRWLIQEGRESVTANVIRENLVRFDELPWVQRVNSLPDLPAGVSVELDISKIDLLELTLHCEFKRIAGDNASTC